MGFMFSSLHISLKLPFVRGYKFVEFALLLNWKLHDFSAMAREVCHDMCHMT